MCVCVCVGDVGRSVKWMKANGSEAVSTNTSGVGLVSCVWRGDGRSYISMKSIERVEMGRLVNVSLKLRTDRGREKDGWQSVWFHWQPFSLFVVSNLFKVLSSGHANTLYVYDTNWQDKTTAGTNNSLTYTQKAVSNENSRQSASHHILLQPTHTKPAWQ